MADRDKYGNYINEKGVTIKITTDRNGNDHVSFYGNDVDKNHEAQHVNIDYNNKSWNSTYHNEDKSEKSSGSGGCYLTSACMEHQKELFNDNCEELTILRWFRDNFVDREDIEHYYATAPIIVDAINQNEECNEIYKAIYYRVIKECVDAINRGDFEFAYQRYKESILQLEELYARPSLEQRLIMSLKRK